MSEPFGPGDAAMSPTVIEEIERVCDRFEAAWRAGRRPRIEDDLGGLAGPARHDLLRALLAIELAYRCQYGERPDRREYRARFPDDAGPVRLAFTELGQAAGPADHLGTAPGESDDGDPGGTGTSHGEPDSAGGRYRILRFHAEGGLGRVFVARDAELRREVALKRIKDEHADDPHRRARFLVEAEITGNLEHPGIVPVYGLGHHADGRHFYAMRFIQGDSLREAIARFHRSEASPHEPGERELELRRLLGRFLDVCNAMAYAHSRGVLHRDLKPGNIMLGPYGETLVVDWGLAKSLGRADVAGLDGERTLSPESGSQLEPTAAGSAVGTPAYMSPEQAAGRLDQLGPRSDVYGLGATLYHLLTGHAPCEADGPGGAGRKVRAGEIPRPRSFRPRLAPALEAICLRALALKPEDRYESAEALKADLEHWLADEPVTAWREPLPARARRWMRRHRTLVVSATSVLAFALVALTAFAAVVAGQNRKLDDANRLLVLTNRALDDRNQELDRQRRRAEQREALALGAVKKFRDAVQANAELKNRPELEALRKALLKEPLEFFATLRDQHQADGDTHAQALEKLATANFDLAETTREIGSIPDAIRSYTEVIAIRERLVRDHSASAECLRDLGRSYNSVGNLLRATGLPAKALDSYRRALEIKERLARDHPDDARFQRDLAISYNNLSITLSETGQPAEALDSHRRTLAIRERLARDHPSATEFQADLAISHNNIGALLSETGRLVEALASYRRALATQERLAHDHPEVAQFQRDLTRSHDNIGDRQGQTGQPVEALDSHRRALEVRQRLARGHPSVTEFQADLAISHDRIGGLLSETGRSAEALASYRRALEIRERLAHDHPDVTEYRSDLAISHYGIGDLLRATAQPAGALDSYRRALEICEGLAHDHPSVTRFQNELASSQNRLGDLLSEAGRPTEAMEFYRRALAIRERLARAHPDVIRYQRNLSISHNNIGTLLSEAGHPAEAIASYRRALEIKERLAREDPSRSDYRSDLRATLHNLAIVEMDQGRWPGARGLLERAIEQQRAALAVMPGHPQYRQSLGRHLVNLTRVHQALGQPTEAARATRDLSGLVPGDPGGLYKVASLLARSAAIARGDPRRELAAEAVRALREAIAAGWSDPVHTGRDPDLIPLHDHDDFRRLVAELFDRVFPSDPFAP
jgi:serine/threonine-protein kinase